MECDLLQKDKERSFTGRISNVNLYEQIIIRKSGFIQRQCN